MKREVLIVVFLITLTAGISYPQKEHYIILQKSDAEQSYNISNKFPKDWIKSKWDEKYNLRNIDCKDGEWFVVMEKRPEFYQQHYYSNPSNQQIDDKLRDGYTIQDICFYVDGGGIQRIYIFTKISLNPVSNYFYAGSPSYDNFLGPLIRKGWDQGWRCKNLKCLKYRNDIEISLLMPSKENNEQIAEYRTDFPNDYINNKSVLGFMLTSITWDYYYKKWFVVMTKNNSGAAWAWFNYKERKADFIDYFNNKGYRIVGVN